MKKTIVLLIATLLGSGAFAKDKAEITPAGSPGRYHCSGDKATCAQIDQNNKMLDAQDRSGREARERRDQERLDRAFSRYYK
jgi:hypothetical protein